MDEILRNRTYRKMFWLIMGLCITVLVLTRIFIIPSNSIAQSINDSLLSSIATTVLIGSLIFYLSPKLEERRGVVMIEAAEIGDYLKEALYRSKTWQFKGGLGRWNRKVTLPKFAKLARSRSEHFSIDMVIIDPTDTKLCEEYAKYRSGRASAFNERPWTADRVKAEALATILDSARLARDESMLTIRIGLHPDFSTLRVDASELYVLVTNEDPNKPAIRADAGTRMYTALKDEVALALRRSTKVQIHRLGADISLSNGLEIRAAIEALGIEIGEKSPEFLELIKECLGDEQMPYEN